MRIIISVSFEEIESDTIEFKINSQEYITRGEKVLFNIVSKIILEQLQKQFLELLENENKKEAKGKNKNFRNLSQGELSNWYQVNWGLSMKAANALAYNLLFPADVSSMTIQELKHYRRLGKLGVEEVLQKRKPYNKS